MRVVRSLDELLHLPADRQVNGFVARAPLMLEIPALSRPMLLLAQEALNGLQRRRGIFAGAAFMFGALSFGVFQVLRENVSILSLSAVYQLAVVIAASVALGVAARWLALAITRWQFAYRCHVQYRLLSMLLPR